MISTMRPQQQQRWPSTMHHHCCRAHLHLLLLLMCRWSPSVLNKKNSRLPHQSALPESNCEGKPSTIHSVALNVKVWYQLGKTIHTNTITTTIAVSHRQYKKAFGCHCHRRRLPPTLQNFVVSRFSSISVKVPRQLWNHRPYQFSSDTTTTRRSLRTTTSSPKLTIIHVLQ